MTRSIFRAAFALVLVAATSSCWLMNKRADSMLGRDRDALFESWGPPMRSKQDGKGGEVWMYVEENSDTSQGGLKLPSLNDMNAVITEVATGKLTHSNERWNATVVKVSQRTHLFWFDKRGKIIKAQTIEPQ